MDPRPQEADKADHHIDEVIEIEPAVDQGHVARVGPVGKVDVVIGQQGFDGAAQQGREMAGKRCDNEERRLVAGCVLAEVQEVAEWMRGDDLLADRDLPTVDRDLADAEIRPLVRHASVRQQLHRCRGAANERQTPDHRPGMVEPTPKSLGHQANRAENVVVRLVRVVQHEPSYVRAILSIERALQIEMACRLDPFSRETISSQTPCVLKHIFVLTEL